MWRFFFYKLYGRLEQALLDLSNLKIRCDYPTPIHHLSVELGQGGEHILRFGHDHECPAVWIQQPSVLAASAVERESVLQRGDLCIADVEVRLRLLESFVGGAQQLL